MYSKNIQKIAAIMFITVATSSSILADGSILVYNNSLYDLNFVVTTQSVAQKAADPNSYKYVQAPIAPAPTHADGTLVMHPVDANYSIDSQVPMGKVANIIFSDHAIDFDVQIINSLGKVVSQINLGSQLGAVVDVDPARVVYVYSNIMPDTGISVPNSGGVVAFWDAGHPLNSPLLQTFTEIAA